VPTGDPGPDGGPDPIDIGRVRNCLCLTSKVGLKAMLDSRLPS